MKSARQSRPFVILNAAMSLDGKIATYKGDSKMSSPADLRRVHRLRGSVDAIMVGLNTLLVDDPKLTVKFYGGRKPQRIIVDSSARTPLSSSVVKTARHIPTIIATTTRASKTRRDALREKGVKVLTVGSGPRVSVKRLVRRLGALGIRKILLEGGGTLNWSMLRNHLVDEISVAITPKIIGGVDATSLVAGRGSATVADALKLKLLGTSRFGPDLVARYKVLT